MEMSTANAHLIGKCKYCKGFSPVEMMGIDSDNKPFHKSCQAKHDTEVMNMVEKPKQ